MAEWCMIGKRKHLARHEKRPMLQRRDGMKCINCGFEWDAAPEEKVVACPSCGLELAYLSEDASYDKAVAAEREGRLAEAVVFYREAVKANIPCAAYGVYRCLVAEKIEKNQERLKEEGFWLRTAAELGDTLACYFLAKQLAHSGDLQGAAYFLRKSAEGGHETASLKMAYSAVRAKQPGEARYYLDNIVKTSKLAKLWLFFLGKNGDRITPTPLVLEGGSASRLALGKYAESLNLPHLAYRYFAMAEDLAEGMFLRAKYDAEGLGEDKSLPDLLHDLELAGSMGETRAYLYLASVMLSAGDHESTRKKAFDYYTQAARGGNREGQRKLGDCYYEGTLCPKHVEHALRWYGAAAEQGDSIAAERVQELSQALATITAAAEAAVAGGDFHGALRLYVECADMGHTTSACRAAEMFEAGQGCDRNLRLAATYYQKAVEGGSIEAVYRLGMLYSQNKGVRFSYKLASKLLSVAGENGYAEAGAQLEHLRQRRQTHAIKQMYATGSELYHMGKVDEAIRYFLTAAQLGYPKAMYMVACFAEFGDGMEYSAAIADKWFKKAAMAGYDGERGRLKSGYLKQRKRHMM